jgi:2-methylcitrate dehydratase PrpD
MTAGDISQALASFIVASRWEDIAEPVRHEARRSLVNALATGLGGCRDVAVERAAGTLKAFSGPAEASLIGRPERFDVMAAAFLNAISINVFDFDDTHPRTIIHPTAPVAPALFALAEARQMTGADLLHAFVLGVETECRIGNAVSPGHYKRGWHITSTCGVFGAAAASGKILGLDERQMVWALGNASAQASGLIETLGSMAKSISVGNAARNGLLAALMARNGIEGPDRPIEGEWGFVRVTADDPAQDAITDGLGESFEILENTYKPYPCGVVLNPVIDGCLELRSHAGLTVHRVEQITVGGHPLLRERADRPAVDRGREAQVSTQHSIAVTLLRGKAGLAEFADAAVQDPEVGRSAGRCGWWRIRRCRSGRRGSTSPSPTGARSRPGSSTHAAVRSGPSRITTSKPR